METIFDAALLPREDRFRAWQENICDIYVHVDASTDDPMQYYGRVRMAQFGAMTITENLWGSQIVSRRPAHLSKLDKECVYI